MLCAARIHMRSVLYDVGLCSALCFVQCCALRVLWRSAESGGAMLHAHFYAPPCFVPSPTLACARALFCEINFSELHARRFDLRALFCELSLCGRRFSEGEDSRRYKVLGRSKILRNGRFRRSKILGDSTIRGFVARLGAAAAESLAASAESLAAAAESLAAASESLAAAAESLAAGHAESDSHIPARYAPLTLTRGKAACKVCVVSRATDDSENAWLAALPTRKTLLTLVTLGTLGTLGALASVRSQRLVARDGADRWCGMVPIGGAGWCRPFVRDGTDRWALPAPQAALQRELGLPVRANPKP